MDDAIKTREELLKELWELRKWKDEQQAALPKHREDLIRLTLIETAPITMWACDRDCRIVCWNQQAEVVYGFTAKEAIGQNFVQLFVDDCERDQAEKDCHVIIDSGREFRNFLAYDVTKAGEKRTMLTNCFRVWDEESKAYLQAELGLEISDLDTSDKKHRNIRELGSALIAERGKTEEIKRAEMSNLLEHNRCKVDGRLSQKKCDLEEWERKIQRMGNVNASEQSIVVVREKLADDQQYLLRKCRDLRELINTATGMEQLESIRPKIDAISIIGEE